MLLPDNVEVALRFKSQSISLELSDSQSKLQDRERIKTISYRNHILFTLVHKMIMEVEQNLGGRTYVFSKTLNVRTQTILYQGMTRRLS